MFGIDKDTFYKYLKMVLVIVVVLIGLTFVMNLDFGGAVFKTLDTFNETIDSGKNLAQSITDSLFDVPLSV